MNNVSLNLENNMISVAGRLLALKKTADQIVKDYFNTGVSALVGGLATDGTAATLTSALTKGEIIGGVTICQQLQNFFGNAAVAGPSDYLSLACNLVNGSNPIVTALSADVESIGDRLRVIGSEIVSLNAACIEMLSAYNASELAAAVAAISSGTIVFGCSSTKSKLVDGMNALTNFQAMLNSSAVTTGDYYSVVSNWVSGI